MNPMSGSKEKEKEKKTWINDISIQQTTILSIPWGDIKIGGRPGVRAVVRAIELIPYSTLWVINGRSFYLDS